MEIFTVNKHNPNTSSKIRAMPSVEDCRYVFSCAAEICYFWKVPLYLFLTSAPPNDSYLTRGHKWENAGKFSCAGYNSLDVSNRKYEASWNRVGSDSCVTCGQPRLRRNDQVDFQVGIRKQKEAGRLNRKTIGSLSPATTRQLSIQVARGRAGQWVRRSQFTRNMEESKRVFLQHAVSHQKSTKTVTANENLVESAASTERNNATNAKNFRTPKLSDIVSYFKDYCDVAGIHGVRYLSENHRNFFEKMFWCITLVVSAVGCAFMIAQVKTKLDTTPVVVTFAERETNIWHLPFPAVTICPYSKLQTSIFNYTHFAKKFSRDEDLFEDYVSFIGRIESEIEITDRHFYHLNGSLTWIKENFRKSLYNELYGDGISEDFAYLLDKLLRMNTSLLSRGGIHDICNSTSLSQGVRHPDDTELCKNIQEYYAVWVNEVKQKLEALIPACQTVYWWKYSLENYSTTFDENATEFVRKVSFSLDEDLIEVGWNGEVLTTHENLKQIWTVEGSCFTFNMINEDQIYKKHVQNLKKSSGNSNILNDWHPDNGYSTKAGPDTYPRRSISAGYNSRLQIRVAEAVDKTDVLCTAGLTGYTVILHRPEDLPQPGLNYDVHIALDKQATISINPVVMTTSPELEDYDVRKRQCYLSHEKQLEYFKFYSRNNCLLECLTNATLKKCGCVALYMPRNASTPMCGVGMEQCMFSAAREMEIREMNEHLHEISQGEAGKAFDAALTKTECDCLPSCLSITYDADTTTFENTFVKVMESIFSPDEQDHTVSDRLTLSTIQVLYKTKVFIASRRNELYGQIDFLANCGGLLGLFCGFSLISLVELVYFLTIRLWSDIFRRWTTRNKIH